jgi:hypothetical protein
VDASRRISAKHVKRFFWDTWTCLFMASGKLGLLWKNMADIRKCPETYGEIVPYRILIQIM